MDLALELIKNDNGVKKRKKNRIYKSINPNQNWNKLKEKENIAILFPYFEKFQFMGIWNHRFIYWKKFGKNKIGK